MIADLPSSAVMAELDRLIDETIFDLKGTGRANELNKVQQAFGRLEIGKKRGASEPLMHQQS